MTVLILDNFDSFTYNLYQMVQARTVEPVVVHRNNALDWPELCRLAPSRIILSPGPGHPEKPGDFGLCADVIRRHAELGIPVLGVCLGHQGLIHHTGGRIIPAPAILHGKTARVRKTTESPLLAGLPDPFTVMRYHSWVAERDSLPAEWEVIAETETDRLVMAVQHRSHPLYGVQFHPESVGTPEGGQLLGNFLAVTPPQAAQPTLQTAGSRCN